MATILTVDDSRSVRTIVSKQVKDLGFEVEEAEDGVQGLSKLGEREYDLVLLDVTMPNLDGPGMLAKMRESGNKTPVIMLTSESKRSVVSGVMKIGIADYILKPFKPEELKAKVLSVLQGEGGAEEVLAVSSEPAAPAPAEPAARVEAGKQFMDVLVVDDMENVHKKLRTMLPNHVSLNGVTSAQAALQTCRQRVYRVVLVDTEIPDVDSAVLAQQLKVLQPHAAFVALALRTTNDVVGEARAQGFDNVLFKPFNQDNIDDFLAQYFDNQDLLSAEENVLKAAPFAGRADRVDKYYARIGDSFSALLTKVAAACFEDVILDVSAAPTTGDKLAKFLLTAAEQAKQVGIRFAVVGTADLQKILNSYTETKELRFHSSVAEAQAASQA
ncbi:MAG TPA: response regulator [Anaeromyxobacteraceae bacterium]|nr:response regulator [Anaeromyxobacteraceae bacterium]